MYASINYAIIGSDNGLSPTRSVSCLFPETTMADFPIRWGYFRSYSDVDEIKTSFQTSVRTRFNKFILLLFLSFVLKSIGVGSHSLFLTEMWSLSNTSFRLLASPVFQQTIQITISALSSMRKDFWLPVRFWRWQLNENANILFFSYTADREYRRE